MPLEVVGPILLQVCDALEAAHQKGIVHRDLKPDNVYLISLNGKKNFVKVVDFGIARVTDEDGFSSGKTATGMVMGTPAYMRPGAGLERPTRIDGRSDVYSLGVMMFQLATGELPFRGADFGEMLIGHLQRPVPPMHHVPAPYEHVIVRCLEKRAGVIATRRCCELKADLIAFCLEELGIDQGQPARRADRRGAARATPSPKAHAGAHLQAASIRSRDRAPGRFA